MSCLTLTCEPQAPECLLCAMVVAVLLYSLSCLVFILNESRECANFPVCWCCCAPRAVYLFLFFKLWVEIC